MINFDIKMGGEYKIVITKPDGSIQETGWFDNIILNQGLDRIGSSTNEVIGYAQVGTGTSIPAITQVGLDLPLAGSALQSSPNGGRTSAGSPTYTSNFVWFFTFTQGSVIGNITELGVGWASSGNTLFSRALILDNLGVPTSIAITNVDQLTVYYRLKIVPPLTDTTSSITISGTPYSYTGRVANVGSFASSIWNFWASQIGTLGSLTYPRRSYVYSAGSVIGPVTGEPTNLLDGGYANATPGTYTPGTYTRTDTFNWSISQGNGVGGIQAIVLEYDVQGFMDFQYRFNTVIPKDNTKTLSITVGITWTRI